jgi:hypothetical protein
VSCTNVRNNRSGHLFYGVNGRQSAPFFGGFLCVAAPLARTPLAFSGGSPPSVDDCSGTLSLDLNAFAHGLLGGAPQPQLLVVGTTITCQFWARDSALVGTNHVQLSDALEYVVRP